MALIPIMGQPVNLVPNNEVTGCATADICVLYGQTQGTDTEPAETIMVQMKQTPCGDNLIVDGNFPDGSAWIVVSGDIIFADGKANHIVGTSAELNQDITGIDLGSYYKVDVTVTGMSAGTLDIYFTQTGTYSVRITENGIYSFYLYNLGDDDGIDFVWSSDCDASISGVEVFKLLAADEITAYLQTLDGVFVVNLSIDLSYEYVTFYYATYVLAEGCYSVVIIDPCVIADFAGFTEVFVDGGFDDAGEWTVSTDIGAMATISGGKFNIPADYYGKIATAIQPFNMPTNTKLFGIAVLETGTLFLGGQVNFNIDLDGIVQFGILFSLELAQNTTYTKYVTINPLDVSILDQIIQFQNGGTFTPPTPEPNPFYFIGDDSYIKRVSLRVAPYSEVTGIFTSNCLKVSADVGDTKIVEGFGELNDISTNPIKGRSLDFLFIEDYFWLKARLDVSFANPKNAIKQENNLFSDGLRKKAFAQVTKVWDLSFIGCDENMHDTISNIISCDTFTIEGQEYITDEKDYSPKWNAKSAIPVADSKIEVQKAIGTRFNNND